MTVQKKFKQQVRERMAATGEIYTKARQMLLEVLATECSKRGHRPAGQPQAAVVLDSNSCCIYCKAKVSIKGPFS